MGVLQWVVYHPHQGKTTDLLNLIRMHRRIIVAKGMTTKFPSIYMRDSSQHLIMEIVEWATAASAFKASKDGMIRQEVWQEFEQSCDMLTLSSIVESKELFPCFERMDVITLTELSSIEQGHYGVIVYRVRRNKEKDFLEALSRQRGVLLDQKYVTDFEPIYMRSPDGSLIEIREWQSKDKMLESQVSSRYPRLFQDLCDIVSLDFLPEARVTYPTFNHIERLEPATLEAPTAFVSPTEGSSSV